MIQIMFGRTKKDEDLKTLLANMLQQVDASGHPNLAPLAAKLRDIDNIGLNIKFFGYELARALADQLPIRTGLVPTHVGLKSKPSTQADLESDWAAYWSSQLKVPVVFHRKLWELTYVLQTVHEHGLIRTGVRGLGFGCGEEPLTSYFAAAGVNVTVTDLPPEEMQSAGWAAGNQHLSSREACFKEHLVSREQFDRNVELRYVDMNAIPPDLKDFDFCWSVCALEHLGSIEKGLSFIENALGTLRPGGLGVHTTEFNFANDEQTIDNWPTVLFQRRHFQDLGKRIQAAGHFVAPLDFDVGRKPLDRFIDLPPFTHGWPENLRAQWGGGEQHIKLSIDGFPCTCFGIIIKKAG